MLVRGQASPFIKPLLPQTECFRTPYLPLTGVCAGTRILVSACMQSLQQLTDRTRALATSTTRGIPKAITWTSGLVSFFFACNMVKCTHLLTCACVCVQLWGLASSKLQRNAKPLCRTCAAPLAPLPNHSPASARLISSAHLTASIHRGLSTLLGAARLYSTGLFL